MSAWVLGGFSAEETMVRAAEALRADGFVELECYSPHPVHGSYDVVPGRARVAPLVLLGGACGLIIGFLLQWWANAFNFPINVGGRPAFSAPTYVPICFESMVLLASFAGLYGFFILCRLPRLHHELQHSELFARHTVDRYLVVVRWERPTPTAPLTERLQKLGATELEEVLDT